jgi:hypothetical protein
MPMSFPDLTSLKDAARVHKFRDIKNGEPEIEFRNALADHVASVDFVESEEIRNGVSWDQFNEGQKRALLGRSILGKGGDQQK